jgi:hypothetical protein
VILSTTTVSTRLFTIDVPENFVDAFKTTNGVAGYLNDPSITLTFNNLPNGVFLNLAGGATGTSNTLCTNATADPSQLYLSATGVIEAGGPTVASLSNTIISNTTNTSILSFTGIAFNNTQLETLRLRGCIYTSGATAPLTPGTVTVSATMSPNGPALINNTQITPVAGNFPRFAVSNITGTVININQAETDMLFVFAVRNSSGFDTGISISNTTSDPFGTNGATPNDGTVTLNFYPQGSGSPFTYTTAAGSPGVGLSATGTIATGKTWSVLLSELLGAQTPAVTSFTGYIFARAGFTNAHGAAFNTNFAGFTSSTPVLIVPIGPRGSTNENLNN